MLPFYHCSGHNSTEFVRKICRLAKKGKILLRTEINENYTFIALINIIALHLVSCFCHLRIPVVWPKEDHSVVFSDSYLGRSKKRLGIINTLTQSLHGVLYLCHFSPTFNSQWSGKGRKIYLKYIFLFLIKSRHIPLMHHNQKGEIQETMQNSEEKKNLYTCIEEPLCWCFLQRLKN